MGQHAQPCSCPIACSSCWHCTENPMRVSSGIHSTVRNTRGGVSFALCLGIRTEALCTPHPDGHRHNQLSKFRHLCSAPLHASLYTAARYFVIVAECPPAAHGSAWKGSRCKRRKNSTSSRVRARVMGKRGHGQPLNFLPPMVCIEREPLAVAAVLKYSLAR